MVQPFDYVRPHTIDDVVALLANDGEQVRILSGGTDLLVQLREGRRAARLVVDIKQLPEVSELRYDDARRLAALGILPRWPYGRKPPRAFPGSFVADPPAG